jgi:hypothetical protein
MTKTPEEIFSEIQVLFRRLSHEVCSVIESYYIWRTLTFSRSIPEMGQEEADKNAELMTICKEFFMPTERAHLHFFVIGLMKFFDRKPPALSFVTLMDEIKKHADIFTPEVFRNVHPKLHQLGAIEEDYLPIRQEVIDDFQQLEINYEKQVGVLKTARDKQFAHTDFLTVDLTFIPLEVEALIEAITEMFNKLSNCFELSSTTFDHLKEDAIRSTQLLLENFKRGEKVRMEEIHKSYLP